MPREFDGLVALIDLPVGDAHADEGFAVTAAFGGGLGRQGRFQQRDGLVEPGDGVGVVLLVQGVDRAEAEVEPPEQVVPRGIGRGVFRAASRCSMVRSPYSSASESSLRIW